MKNEINYSTMCDIIKQNTRNYAKRQITFFKKLPGILWLDPYNKENMNIILMKGPLLIAQPVDSAEFALHTNWSLLVQTVAAVVTQIRRAG